MDREELAAVAETDPPLIPPFPLLMVGLGAIAAAWLLGAALSGGASVLRASLIVLGVVAVGSALALHLPGTRRDLENRLGAAGMWALAAIATFIARLALDPAWDSIGLLFQVMTLVCAAGAVLTVLPAGSRMLAISLLIVFHFGGIALAIVNVPPPNGNPPWMATFLWTRVYRPYLTITNLNNGYHFYAPEPGPCALLWFRVEYLDGSSRWVRIPNHEACRNHIERRRLGALATAIGQTAPQMPSMRLQGLLERRMAAGMSHNPPIPMMPPGEMPLASQYREPMLPAKMLLASYAPFVARTTEHPLGESSPVIGVKIYHVEFHNPLVQNFAAGQDPLDPTLYTAVYQGEYDVDGRLKPNCLQIIRDDAGREIDRKQDPFLYWVIPIVRVPEQGGAQASGSGAEAGKPDPREAGRWFKEGKIMNYVRIHAGDKDEEAIP